MTHLNLRDEQNKQLIKIVSNEDINSIEEEIEFKIFKLAKSLNQRKITKSTSSPKPVQKATQEQASRSDRTVMINFHCNEDTDANYLTTFKVNTSWSVDELIEQIKSKSVRKKQHVFLNFLGIAKKSEPNYTLCQIQK